MATLPMISKVKCDNIKPKSLLDVVVYCSQFRYALTNFMKRLLINTDIGTFNTFNRLNSYDILSLLEILKPENAKAIQESINMNPYQYRNYR